MKSRILSAIVTAAAMLQSVSPVSGDLILMLDTEAETFHFSGSNGEAMRWTPRQPVFEYRADNVGFGGDEQTILFQQFLFTFENGPVLSGVTGEPHEGTPFSLTLSDADGGSVILDSTLQTKTATRTYNRQGIMTGSETTQSYSELNDGNKQLFEALAGNTLLATYGYDVFGVSERARTLDISVSSLQGTSSNFARSSTAVPEPGSTAILGISALGFVIYRRRRNRQASRKP